MQCAKLRHPNKLIQLRYPLKYRCIVSLDLALDFLPRFLLCTSFANCFQPSSAGGRGVAGVAGYLSRKPLYDKCCLIHLHHDSISYCKLLIWVVNVVRCSGFLCPTSISSYSRCEGTSRFPPRRQSPSSRYGTRRSNKRCETHCDETPWSIPFRWWAPCISFADPVPRRPSKSQLGEELRRLLWISPPCDPQNAIG